MIRSRFGIPVLVSLLSPVVAACDAGFPTSPASDANLSRASSTRAVSKPQLAVCPTNTTERVSGTIGAAGGSIELAGHRLTIPAGAVTRPTRFTLTVPAGPHLKIEVTAAGTRPNRRSAPAAVTISYERCERQNFVTESAKVLSLDARTDEAVALLEGEHDPAQQTLTFSVDLWSEMDGLFVARGIYAVAY